MKKNHPVKLLTIAGSDSGGGAGVQADLKTFGAFNCFGMSVVTVLTAQNSQEVAGIHDVPSNFVSLQIRTVLGDLGADAIKVGMLRSAEITSVVAEELTNYTGPIVIDPVMVAQSGAELMQEEAILALKTKLLPLATLVTPNIPEAEAA